MIPHLATTGLLCAWFITRINAEDFTLSLAKPIVQSPALNEASGLAASLADEAFLWAINDSGGAPELHLLRTDGADCGKVTLTNAKNIDWEDLASFSLQGKSYLLIADTGDNSASRKSCTLYILQEPNLPAAGKKLKATIPCTWSITFRYEDGPRDCEAVAVDPTARKIILISKRTQPPTIYELPLPNPKMAENIIARKIGNVLTNSPTALFTSFTNQPVGLDFSSDQSLAAIVTYYSVFLFPRTRNETWSQAFSKKPTLLKPHGLRQAESIAFSKNAKRIHIISEGVNQPIITYQQ